MAADSAGDRAFGASLIGSGSLGTVRWSSQGTAEVGEVGLAMVMGDGDGIQSWR